MKKRDFTCITLLNSFSEKDIEGLLDLASCRYFNNDHYVAILLKVLEKYVLQKRTFDENTQIMVYDKVFNKSLGAEIKKLSDEDEKKEAIEPAKRLLFAKMTLLKNLAEQFITIKSMKENGAHKNELLYPVLLEQKQFRLFDRKVKKDKKLILEKPVKTAEDYDQLYRTEVNINNYLNITGKVRKENNLFEVAHSLDMYYLLSRLDLQLGTLSFQRNLKTRIGKFPKEDALQPLLDFPAYAKHPLIILYLAGINLMRKYTDKSYTHLVGLLEKYHSVSPTQLLKNLYTACINYCIHKIKMGTDFNRDMFELYKTMHDKNLMLDKGLISPHQLKNMVIIACRVEEFDWAMKITNHYNSLTRKSIRDSVLNFNLGIIAFHKGDFETAHDEFVCVEKIDLNFDNNVRVLIAKCLYEKKSKYYDERVVTSFRSHQRYFREHDTLSSKQKKSYVNFIKVLIYLYKIHYGKSKVSLEKVKQELTPKNINADKKWLLEKITELKSKQK